MVVDNWLTFWVRKIKIDRVLFFFTPPYFWGQTENFKVCWLWAAITPVKKLARPKSTTFSETSGRELWHGPILEKFSHQKISMRGFLAKNAVFWNFSCPSRKNFQMAANRTILILEGLPMAHLKAYVPNFPKHMRKRSQSLKLWVLATSEVRWSKNLAAKIGDF